ncbi:imelysin family protein [Pseudoalteromonas sp. MMG010]|uniref:imelysin family protein n=1 Tax=Pseudoalteromonas sp. MMG010 TaxID=2822685 RepID=UPI001B39D2A6|nr:imelysin family protein [Pseudoalteromonas sp. MMG010]MBQ4833143.1 imelysin family protein [Pseudoalteromonas sp. MMG010]
MSFTTKKALAIAIFLSLSGCGESSSSSTGSAFQSNDSGQTSTSVETEFDEAQLIANLVDNVITPTFILFNQQAQIQTQALMNYCQAELASIQESSEAAVSLRIQAQQAWLDTMASWQQAEMMQMGPLLENSSQLRNQIYSWPTFSRCGIDQDVVYNQDGVINQDQNRPYEITDRTATRRGLFALQHVLFNEQLDHHCSVTNDALADWNNRTDLARRQARCEFAVVASDDVLNSSAQLLQAWQGDNGFANELKNVGESDSRFSSNHEALNHISDALFYIDTIVKDKKLAEPIGIFSNSCGTSACPEDVESVDAKSSLANIRNNLAAFEALIIGNLESAQTGVGFDDFLDAEQAEETKVRLVEGIAALKTTLDSIDSSLADLLIDNEQQVRDVHGQVKILTDELKNDFINELALELPTTSAGDND